MSRYISNMEIDITNISDLLREVIEFLECLRDVQLSLTLENLREKLLTRSKDTLSLTRVPRGSPEPYLDMNSGLKSLLLRKNETDTEEYVGMEGSKRQSHHQDYYETFENEAQGVANDRSEQNDDETEEGRMLLRIYKKLSAAQIRSKCHKCGPLFKKEGKKLFLPEGRTCWVALIGSHLLIYRNERHNQPHGIHPIRGYMARPAPNLIPRDRQKSESAFEIYRPGNETLRFIARTPKDMEQWIAKICEMGGNPAARSAKVKSEGRGKKRRTNPVVKSSTDRDAKDSTLDDLDSPIAKDESASNKGEEVQEQKRDSGGNPPPLPARIPRRLPSLPPDDAISCYKAVIEDDEDEDDIYHKIEDLKNGTCYQNMMLSRKQRGDKKRETVVAYDDVRAPEEGNNEGQTREEGDAKPSEETYDDIALRINATANSEWQNHDPRPDGEEKQEEFYDDVENLLQNGKLTKDRAKDPSKSPQKKSFLERVLSRKESPGKSDKRYKGKTSSSPPPSSTKEEILSIYDDASDVIVNRESLADEEKELSEYNCPPPPRPVYTKSTIPNGQVDQAEDLYDDVNACREQHKHQQTSLQSTQKSGVKTRETPGNGKTEQKVDNDPSREEIEHYQSPRSDLCVRDFAENQQGNEEDLYDDIALWKDFTARLKDINEKRDEDAATRSTISSDKRSWNRKFAAINRKSRGNDSIETNNRRGGANECDEIDVDSSEGNGGFKRNTFQKLISRMENSLAKVSSRGHPSFPPTDK
ncbi:uncharacterized protein LOC114946406 [Nylanderia fulva]|uniref:uncharacterized protein LOC114946406 n=1 Tax=Nylanderia fulva TaxID=613905 RepID=UPI0010FB658E|nr:uncharacterized protein LOC114946406 [Nylanderia fulva]XP_029178712.1 uncharacterized protein LOC114946406 [Nylanderia fulva]XP_029178720.1 uncharacterized protein LOC114946406 [Nylanderia fulva]XP_029178729.1 uncharacterized protein LOC114946406 [Nylanderia fulva]XP_029178738.1 uncharacterized protein LOC114946406 [Nylanderia fulva]